MMQTKVSGALSRSTANSDVLVADDAMRKIWSEWFTFYTNHFRGNVAISAADQMAFYEIAQPIIRALVRPTIKPSDAEPVMPAAAKAQAIKTDWCPTCHRGWSLVSAPTPSDAMTDESAALHALRLHEAYELVPADRGGTMGPKGRAWKAFTDAKAKALATPRRPTS